MQTRTQRPVFLWSRLPASPSVPSIQRKNAREEVEQSEVAQTGGKCGRDGGKGSNTK